MSAAVRMGAMRINVRLFAMMAEQAGAGVVALDLPLGSAAAAVRPELEKRFDSLKWPAGAMLAVNQEYAGAGRKLSPGDEVAVIPPVSGG